MPGGAPAGRPGRRCWCAGPTPRAGSGRDNGPDVRGMSVKFRPLRDRRRRHRPARPDGAAVPGAHPRGRSCVHRGHRRPEATLPSGLARHPGGHRGAGRQRPGRRRSARRRSFAEVTYFPIHAYGWRDATDDLQWVRYRLEPVDAAAGRPDGEYEGRTGSSTSWPTGWPAGPVRYDLRVTVARRHATTRTTRCRSGAAPGELSAGIVDGDRGGPRPRGRRRPRRLRPDPRRRRDRALRRPDPALPATRRSGAARRIAASMLGESESRADDPTASQAVRRARRPGIGHAIATRRDLPARGP